MEGRHVAFLFTDNHIVNESFVEDINNILNSGEITGLFPADERERIYSDIRCVVCVCAYKCVCVLTPAWHSLQMSSFGCFMCEEGKQTRVHTNKHALLHILTHTQAVDQ